MSIPSTIVHSGTLTSTWNTEIKQTPKDRSGAPKSPLLHSIPVSIAEPPACPTISKPELAASTETSVCRDYLSECECTNSNGVFAGNGTTCGFELTCTGPIVEILTPGEGDTFPEFSDILITVDAYDVNTGGFVEQVKFLIDLDGAVVESIDTNGTDGWSYLLEDAPGGNFMLNVVATDNDGLTGTASLLLRVECPTPVESTEFAQTCTGTVDCPLASLPFGPDSQTRTEPYEFDLGGTGNSCFPTMGRTLAATELYLNGLTEAQLFTNLPATEIISGGTLYAHPLQGCTLHAAGTICMPLIGQALSVTDRTMGAISGGILSEHPFPDNSLPLSAAGIVTCSGACSNTFTFAVETTANTIETVSGGEIISFPIGEPINDLPISYTNGTISGILAFTNTNSHTISGGIDDIVPLNGQYIGNRIGPDGVTVFTTGDGTCYPTLGKILAATAAGVDAVVESVLFTDAPLHRSNQRRIQNSVPPHRHADALRWLGLRLQHSGIHRRHRSCYLHSNWRHPHREHTSCRRRTRQRRRYRRVQRRELVHPLRRTADQWPAMCIEWCC